MKRTISLKLDLAEEQSHSLVQTQEAFFKGCNEIVPFAQESRCWNQVALHHFCYTAVRKEIPALGSQMVCNAIRKVCASYKVLKIKKSQEVPKIAFKSLSSIHYCARTFSLKGDKLSLFSINGRIRCSYIIGEHQVAYLSQGKVKEGELIRKGKRWFFNLVLDIPDSEKIICNDVFAVDLGENNLATTSKGTIYGGGKLRHKRDRFLDRRKKLQSNGSKSAMRCLKKISGKEARYVRETNYIVSKAIIEEAGSGTIVMEKLTHIRKRIKGGKRNRCRLHHWAWHQLQQFIEYKAEAKGIPVLYVSPAYTSLNCSTCGSLGSRHKHQFKCFTCGSFAHSDRNACQNLCKLGLVCSPSNGICQ